MDRHVCGKCVHDAKFRRLGNDDCIVDVDLSSDASVDTVEVVATSHGASPFSALVAPAAISGSHTTAEDDLMPVKCASLSLAAGADCLQATLSAFSKATVLARDQFSNRIMTGKLDEIQLRQLRVILLAPLGARSRCPTSM